uniref:DUF6497 family protein n=1 Tax=Yoonia sp. TaxID=2212373 RepID=UPI0040475183
MRFLAVIFAILASPAAAVEIAVPSGRVLTLFDMRMEPEMARFRFVLPEVGAGLGFADILDDIEYVCAQVALPALTQSGSGVTQLVISVSAEQVPFGAATDVVQYFQPFRRDGDACIWEEF